MNYFRYKLIAPSGNVSSGVLKLPYQDVLSAVTHLERDGSMTIYVKKLGYFVAFFLKLSAFSFISKLTRTDQAEILSNMSLMLRSGVALTTALQEAAEGSELSDISNDINDMIVSIQGGAVFSEAAANYKHIFPQTIIHLVKIGEETGQLDLMLKNGAEHLKNLQKIISDTKQALLYPSFVFFSMGVLFLFWFYFVVPKIIGLFQEMDVTLPGITVFLMSVSDFLKNNTLIILINLILIPILFNVARKNIKIFKKATDVLLLKLPVSGTIAHASNLAYITEYLSLLINAGVDILRSISIMRDSVANELYREKLKEIKSGLTRGEGIAEAFTNAAIFPSFVTRMMGIGELSGTLTEQLEHIADEYRSKLTLIVSTIGKMIEPIVLIVAGAMFAVIIGGLLLPIYDLISAVSG